MRIATELRFSPIWHMAAASNDNPDRLDHRGRKATRVPKVRPAHLAPPAMVDLPVPSGSRGRKDRQDLILRIFA